MLKHILLATDGSAASDKAAVYAVNLARTCGAKLTALHAVNPYPYEGVGEENHTGLMAYAAAAQQEAAVANTKVAALCAQDGAPVDFHTAVVESKAVATAIVEYAQSKGVDLIVVGSHGRSGIARMLLGSVTARVLAESTLPVLVVR